uniref:hypothetical protein n=1 Tax=Methylobacterium sp. B34 TaxID=95563 RepID=UPI000345EB41|nr:hypothetical protein [Methylobacterium sp. B34]
MTLIKTYSPKNEALIVCPIFGAETRLADCLELEQQVARGRKPDERRGCQACLMSSKCPVYWINRAIIRTGEDPYFSAEPKVLPLKGEILEAVRPILVRDDAVNRYAVEGAEAEAIRAANEAASAGKPRAAKKTAGVKLAAVKREESAPAGDDGLKAAALSGDLSAAVTRAVAKASETPQEAPAPAPAPKAVAPAPKPPAAAPAQPKPTPKPAPAPAGKGMSLLEMARARAAAQQKDQAA